jgi:hypothetical protein
MHIRDILINLTVFIAFEFCVFLIQGKFGFYRVETCNWKYPFGLGLLVVASIVYL